MTRHILEFLKDNQFTHFSDIKIYIEKLYFGNRCKEGLKKHLPDKEALLINEIICDLIVQRILTPGVSELDYELPWMHVSDMKKLNTMLADKYS